MYGASKMNRLQIYYFKKHSKNKHNLRYNIHCVFIHCDRY